MDDDVVVVVDAPNELEILEEEEEEEDVQEEEEEIFGGGLLLFFAGIGGNGGDNIHRALKVIIALTLRGKERRRERRYLFSSRVEKEIYAKLSLSTVFGEKICATREEILSAICLGLQSPVFRVTVSNRSLRLTAKRNYARA